MARIRRLTVAGMVLAAGLLAASTASAGPLVGWFTHEDSPPPSYSPFRYWTPRAARVSDKIHGPRLSVYAPDRHPEIAPDYVIIKFPHPAADPASTIIEPPTPPVTSRFRY